MFAAIAQALASAATVAVAAPLAATGGISKGVGQALQMGGDGIPIIGAAGQAMEGAGEAMSTGASRVYEGGANLSFEGMGVDFASLGRSISGITSSLNPGSREVSQSLSQVRAPEISAPTTQFCVSAADLGNFSPVAPGGGGSGGISIA